MADYSSTTDVWQPNPGGALMRLEDAIQHYRYAPMPRAAMREVGPAAQTLGAVYQFANRDGSTFAAAGTLAGYVRLPEDTTRKHLRTLIKAGWIESRGRENRRSTTHVLTDRARHLKEPYAMLPVWAGGMPLWSARALFAYVVSREGLIDTIEEAGDGAMDQRRVYRLAEFERELGLSRPSIVNGLRWLESQALAMRLRYTYGQTIRLHRARRVET